MIALTERDFKEFMLHITGSDEPGNLSVDGLIDRYLNDGQWLLDYDRAALAQEVLAEAARNPRVAELVRASITGFGTPSAPLWSRCSKASQQGKSTDASRRCS